ncbi:MAG TPA: HAD-IA family hydrolase [Gryllotalpicola sp.]
MTELFPCRAVLFDSDGVLVDSKAAGEAAWIEWSHRHALRPETVLEGMHGRRSRETVALYLAPDEVDAGTADIDRLELDTAGETVEIPGAAALLGSIPDSSRAVVTSAGGALAAARLTAAGVPRPTTIVSAELVAQGKPAPDPYLAAAAALGIPIGDCLIFEDSENGIRSARAAGVGVLIGVGPTALDLGCEAVVPDLSAARWAGNGIEISRRLDG